MHCIWTIQGATSRDKREYGLNSGSCIVVKRKCTHGRLTHTRCERPADRIHAISFATDGFSATLSTFMLACSFFMNRFHWLIKVTNHHAPRLHCSTITLTHGSKRLFERVQTAGADVASMRRRHASSVCLASGWTRWHAGSHGHGSPHGRCRSCYAFSPVRDT